MCILQDMIANASVVLKTIDYNESKLVRLPGGAKLTHEHIFRHTYKLHIPVLDVAATLPRTSM
jgi:hypothetical protein